MNRPEELIQRACAIYLDHLGKLTGRFVFFHPANGGYRTKVEAAKFKLMGVKAGVPDLVILFEGGRTLFIELKAGKGRLTDKQIGFHATLMALGHPVNTITAETPGSAVAQLASLLRAHGVKEAT